MSILNTIRQFLDDRRQFRAGSVRIAPLRTTGRIYRYFDDLEPGQRIHGFYPMFRKRFLRQLEARRREAAAAGVPGTVTVSPVSGVPVKVRPKVEVTAKILKRDGTVVDLGRIA